MKICRTSIARFLVPVIGAGLLTVSDGLAQLEAVARVPATYTNPIGTPPILMGDPYVLQHEGRYFLFGTTKKTQGFEYFESDDLVNWRAGGWAWRKTDQSWASTHFWAPEVHAYRGKFYLIYSGQMRDAEPWTLRLALAVADRPEGPYRDLHAPWWDGGYSAIDGNLFVDDDGTPYLYFSRNGARDGYLYGMVYGVQLAEDLSAPLGEPVLQVEASQPWELKHPEKNRCNEGSTVLKHQGVYYMTYSADNTAGPDYAIGVATAPHPLGPWTKDERNPLVASDLARGISGPGHNSLTRSPDGSELFMVYHTHEDAANPGSRRVVNIDRLVFDETGRMLLRGPTRSPQPRPAGAP